MKLNNKGITLIEIIVSIVLISIVLVFLSIMLVDVKDLNDESQSSSLYLIRTALITKTIEDDLKMHNKININEIACSTAFTSYCDDDKFNECISITFEDSTSAKLGLFYLTNPKNDYVISYIHGNVVMTEVLSDYKDYNILDSNIRDDKLKMNVVYNVVDGLETKYYDDLEVLEYADRAILINIPIIGNDGKDYTISIPYYGSVGIKK